MNGYFNSENEVLFPDEAFVKDDEGLVNEPVNENINTELRDFSNLIADLNKQVSNADGSVSELVKQRDNIQARHHELDEIKSSLENDRFNFERQMKEEYQKLNDLKIDFEQEKNKVFNEIQRSREELAKNQRDFEKYRKEQMTFIENSKKMLTKNYDQFSKVVATFNNKIENYDEKSGE